MTDLSHFQQAFFEECRELLQETEDRLMDLENGTSDDETLHAIFRAVHSIKGGGGAFGHDRLVHFAHVLETVFDLLRSGELDLSPDVLATLMEASDVLSDLVLSSMAGKVVSDDLEVNALAALADIAATVAAEDAPEDDDDDFDFTPVPVGGVGVDSEPPSEPDSDVDRGAQTTHAAMADKPDDETPTLAAFEASGTEEDLAHLSVEAALPSEPEDDAPAPAGALDTPEPAGSDQYHWTIRLRPHPSLFQRANDPLLLARELKELGVLQVHPDTSALPDLVECDPDGGYITWTFDLITDQDRSAIEEVFDFVQGDCDLAIEGAHEQPAALEVSGEPGAFDGADTVTAVAAAAHDPADEPAVSPPLIADVPAPAPPADDGASDTRGGDDTSVPGSETKSADAKTGGGADRVRSIRVELDKIDRMINMVGELVISQSMLAQRASQLPAAHAGDIANLLEMLMQQMRQLQDNVMAVRASPVKTVFSRMPRLVRELSRALGKKVKIRLIGEETELDKTVIEQLADPLTHMIRNSMDHGIESPAERRAAGKPEEGTIELSASHVSGQIQIVIRDDGRGINREKVLAKAQDKGLVPAGVSLSDQQIDQLIFAPGFSTADTLSDVSGRGVGTDVVRRNIEAMGGRVEVTSVPGEGCTFTMMLPLTLAIMDGMVLRVGSTEYVIPIASVVESAFPADLTLREPSPGTYMVHYRGDYIPLVHIDQVFNVPRDGAPDDDGLIIICDVLGGRRVAIHVDAILGQQQVVVKSLEENFKPVAGIAAATILGDGRVSLILDVNGVMRLAA